VTDDRRAATKVAFFDSGVGGLSAARAFLREVSRASVMYVADTARFPYGERGSREVTRFTLRGLDFVAGFEPSLAVLACNTADAAVGDRVERRYGFPVLGVIDAGVNAVSAGPAPGTVGIIGTRYTIRSMVYERKIRETLPRAKVVSAACAELVALVERGRLESAHDAVERCLEPILIESPDAIVLGCTHFSFVVDIVREVAGRGTRVVDPVIEVARRAALLVSGAPERGPEAREGCRGEDGSEGAGTRPTGSSVRYLVSGDPERFADSVEILLGSRPLVERWAPGAVGR